MGQPYDGPAVSPHQPPPAGPNSASDSGDATDHQAHPLVRLWQYGGRYRVRLVKAVFWSTVNKFADVFPELLVGAAVDVVVQGVQGGESLVERIFGVQSTFGQLLVLAAINVVVWIIESIADYFAATTWRRLAQSVEHDLRTETYAHLQELEIGWFEDTTSGGLLAVLNDDVNQLERFLDTGADTIIGLFWNLIIVGAVFFAVSWQMAVVAFLPVPVIVLGSLRYQRRLAPLYAKVREQVSELSATLSANLGGMATIKAFGAEGREAKRVATVSQDYLQANSDAIAYSSAFVPIIRMAILAGFTATLLIGGWLTIQGELAIGLYSVLVFMTQRLLWPLTHLGETLDLYQRGMASTRRILDLLDVEARLVPGTHDLALPVRGDLELHGVTFGYGEGAPVLRDIDLRVPAGETHAIVGATGAGKSTLVRMLLRFYEPRAGVVTLDDVDVRDLTYASLRGAIGYVAQDVFLFHGTVRDNIAYGRPEASDEEIEEAARLAEAHDFVLELPDSYATIVGERGVKLSGGQRQRLSIARAILRDPAVLLLDEATSAVDNETEAAIQRSLARVGEGRTVVVVAHRLSTVRDADRIWVLEAGGIAEAGTHDELVAGDGLYAALWRVQTGDAVHRVHAPRT